MSDRLNRIQLSEGQMECYIALINDMNDYVYDLVDVLEECSIVDYDILCASKNASLASVLDNNGQEQGTVLGLQLSTMVKEQSGSELLKSAYTHQIITTDYIVFISFKSMEDYSAFITFSVIDSVRQSYS